MPQPRALAHAVRLARQRTVSSRPALNVTAARRLWRARRARGERGSALLERRSFPYPSREEAAGARTATSARAPAPAAAAAAGSAVARAKARQPRGRSSRRSAPELRPAHTRLPPVGLELLGAARDVCAHERSAPSSRARRGRRPTRYQVGHHVDVAGDFALLLLGRRRRRPRRRSRRFAPAKCSSVLPSAAASVADRMSRSAVCQPRETEFPQNDDVRVAQAGLHLAHRQRRLTARR